ncbi:MAG: AzlC family ABC transporter permease, partial [Sphaerochaetaceae bacterium]|nr:AzlC family ABC transporter permease [Sphaerochaetaceae bacterium]
MLYSHEGKGLVKMKIENKNAMAKGFKNALPIFLGYFAVSFSLGINCKNGGLSLFQGTLMSFLNRTSAGQAAGITIIAEKGSYYEIILSQIVINLRYMLMSAALAVRLGQSTSVRNRLLMSLGITDEIFG